MCCPFFNAPADRVFYRDESSCGLWDAFPRNRGHALLVPHRHVASWVDVTPPERAALFEGVDAARKLIDEQYNPDGYNIGINVDAAAEQTIPHLQVHVIPWQGCPRSSSGFGKRYNK